MTLEKDRENFKRRASILFLILILLGIFYLSGALADAGMNEGEKVLDTATNYQDNSYSAAEENGGFFETGSVFFSKITSVLTDTFTQQFQNKERGENQNVELDVAKKNLEDSKDGVTTMFFYIVATFIVLFDAIISMIYIFLIVLVIWLIFTGYVKMMVLIIDMIHGRIRKRRDHA